MFVRAASKVPAVFTLPALLPCACPQSSARGAECFSLAAGCDYELGRVLAKNIRPELRHPSPHRFVGDIQTALGGQIFGRAADGSDAGDLIEITQNDRLHGDARSRSGVMAKRQRPSRIFALPNSARPPLFNNWLGGERRLARTANRPA